ncbi:MAG: restriction endonuclease [Flaviflexus sp.]|nr:restriction endonuclease [Flaviflexus sp.]
MNIDNTPTISQFRPSVLRVLADGEVRKLRDIYELVADDKGLDEETKAEEVSSGQKRYHNRIGWACSGLTQAGLLERPSRGHYRITDDGLTVNARGLAEYEEKDMLEWPTWVAYQKEIQERNNAAASSTPAKNEQSEEVDPIESMTTAERSFNAQTETRLRQRLQASSPEFFEKAVIDLLWAMGYGGTHGGKQHMGQSGDGGIDGVIRQDALGLTNVYVQAKRYADSNSVGSPEIRNFIGALDSTGANLGVFITTSSFAPAAKRTAERYRHGKIVLIDGIKLTSLMLTYNVAVHEARQFTLYEIDEDFFDEELL